MRAGQELQNVKWAAEGMVKGRFAEYSMTSGHTLVAGGMLVPREAHEQS